MKLSKDALGAFKRNTRLKNRIALEMNKSVYSVDRWLAENEENGPLTTIKTLELIRQETGLSDDQILEESVSEPQS